jgi:hypothetical protein
MTASIDIRCFFDSYLAYKGYQGRGGKKFIRNCIGEESPIVEIHVWTNVSLRTPERTVLSSAHERLYAAVAASLLRKCLWSSCRNDSEEEIFRLSTFVFNGLSWLSVTQNHRCKFPLLFLASQLYHSQQMICTYEPIHGTPSHPRVAYCLAEKPYEPHIENQFNFCQRVLATLRSHKLSPLFASLYLGTLIVELEHDTPPSSLSGRLGGVVPYYCNDK